MCGPAGFWLAGDVARCEPDLLTARLDGPAREIKLLSDHRHHLTTERTVFTALLADERHAGKPFSNTGHAPLLPRAA
jgi:hypothetical protein